MPRSSTPLEFLLMRFYTLVFISTANTKTTFHQFFLKLNSHCFCRMRYSRPHLQQQCI
uniref:4-nitrophenylphosphatase n=1 Tax=Solanum tuberosum TaxID=4113 RepID=M1BQX6_SOLTU